MTIQFLVHEPQDTVGVAVADVRKGESIQGRILANNKTIKATVQSDISLGHKFALREFRVGDTVTKYGQDIGKVVLAIKKGEHVHVHNLKTKRW